MKSSRLASVKLESRARMIWRNLNHAGADVRRLILFRIENVRASSRRLLQFFTATFAAAALHAAPEWEAPTSLAVSSDGSQLFVACAKSKHVQVLNAADLSRRGEIVVNGEPSGLALSRDGRVLYVTCAAPVSTLEIMDVTTGQRSASIALGHTSLAPALSPDERTLFVCNRFSGNVSIVDVRSRKETARIPVEREPVGVAVTPDGKRLLVANHLHAGRSDVTNVAARISVIDIAKRRVTKVIALPSGSGLLRDIRVSPDGRHAVVTHLLARYLLPTTQVERGWMNANAITILDLTSMEVLNTVMLDNVESGAANPWACGWTADGTTLFVTHAGTHEVSLISWPGLIAKLGALPVAAREQPAFGYAITARTRSEVASDFTFLTGLRERIPLRGKGPRAAVASGTRLFVASYFSDDLEVIDLQHSKHTGRITTRLSPDRPMSVTQRGEMFFNDATLCLQGWQSCASCHSEDARVDALNWDLLNDGIGNPKNSKSLLYSHRTPPVMSTGVRESAETAVRSGIRHIFFTKPSDNVADAIDAWLKTLQPIPNPHLVQGKLSATAQRGEKIFRRADTGCATCHSGAVLTDLREYDVGTASGNEKPATAFDTPTLIELWRTAPYLHDGSAATLQEVLTARNKQDTHGRTSHLKRPEVEDLTAFLLSL